MNDLIKIETKNEKQLVNARELWSFLESKRQFVNWIQEKIEKYGSYLWQEVQQDNLGIYMQQLQIQV